MLTYRVVERLAWLCSPCALASRRVDLLLRSTKRWFASGSAEEPGEQMRRLSYAGSRFKPLPTSAAVWKQLLNESPESPMGSRMLKVAVLGAPNVGKSTFVNALMGSKIVSVSKKVHTTEKRASAVLSEGHVQIVFVDTPGVVTPAEVRRHRLSSAYLEDPVSSSDEADALIVVHDAASQWHFGSLDASVIRILEQFKDKESLLILNKVDKLKSKRNLLDQMRILSEGIVGGQPLNFSVSKPMSRVRRILSFDPNEVAEKYLSKEHADVTKRTDEMRRSCEKNPSEEAAESEVEEIETFRGWRMFSGVFMVSSLSGDGVREVKERLLDMALPMPWKFHPAVTTDQHPKDLVRQLVREKFMDRLRKEMPYLLDIKIKQWKMVDGVFVINVQVDPRKNFWRKYLIGPGGRRTKEIAISLEQELMNLFHCDVMFKLTVGSRNERE